LIGLESKAKKPDFDKIKDYRAQIVDLNISIEDLKDSLVNEILGTDVKNAASELGDALVDAFTRGEDAAKSWGDTVKKMIFEAVLNSIKLTVFQTAIQPVIDYLDAKTREFNERQVQIAELERYLSRSRGIHNDARLEKIKELKDTPFLTPEDIDNLEKLSDDAYLNSLEGEKILRDMAERLGITDGSTPDGIRGEIKAITEDTARRLEGLLNAVREISVANTGYLSELVRVSQDYGFQSTGYLTRLAESNEAIQGYAGQSLTHLVNIDSNTKGQLDILTNLLVASGSQGGKGLKVYIG
jgi:hypothetical protein